MIITIAGTYGSAGVPVAYKLAELTGYRILDDKEAMKMIKDLDLGISQAEFEYYDENQGLDPLRRMHQADLLDRTTAKFSSYYNMEEKLPLEDRFANALKNLALEFAKDGNCIMVGRCAGYFLKPNDELICFFTTDAIDVRIKRVMEFSSCSEDTAAKLIAQRDRRRADYNKFFTGSATWGDPEHYDYILHTDTLGIDKTAELIAAIIKMREEA